MTTEYLVVHDFGQFSGITIEGPGKVYPHPTQCWAIRTGPQVMVARSKLGKTLTHFHLGGRFQDTANYALSFDELSAVVRMQMGPSDSERYFEASTRMLDAPASAHRPGLIAAQVTSLSLLTVVKFVGLSAKFLMTMLIMPFVIMFFNKRGKP